MQHMSLTAQLFGQLLISFKPQSILPLPPNAKSIDSSAPNSIAAEMKYQMEQKQFLERRWFL